MLKRICCVLLVAVLTVFPVAALAVEGEASPSPSTAPAENPKEGSAGPEEGGDAGTEPQTASLKIDDKNLYDGMEKPYKSGYAPAIKNGKAIIVLPLLAEGNPGKLTVTPNLGDASSAPFVFKNYQKTIGQTEQKINGTEETKKIYYIRFDLPLAKSRMNGTYPVLIDVAGKDISQSFTTYVTIKDGKDPNAVTQEPTVSEPKPESQPIVLVESSSVAPEVVEAGQEFTATVRLKNTNEKKAVQNMTVTISTEAEGFTLLEDTNTKYIKKLGKGESMELQFRYKTGLEVPAGKYSIALAMSYDNTDAQTLASSGMVDVSVSQPMRVEAVLPEVPAEVNAGDTIPMSFQIMNLGRGKVYNARCEIDAPGFIPTGAAFVGNLEPGTAGTADVNVFIGTKDMNTDTPAEEKYGYTSGKITLRYEDENGKESTEEFEISSMINQPIIQSSGEEPVEKKPEAAGQWWITVAIGAAVLIAAVVIVLVRRRKKRYEDA